MSDAPSPSRRAPLGWGLLLVGLACAAPIFLGAPFLGVRLGPIPVGNLLAWGMIAAPPAALVAFPGGAASDRRWARLSLMAAGCWFPVSALLSGNLALVFPGGHRFGLWLAWTGLVLLTGYILLSVRCFQWLRKRMLGA